MKVCAHLVILISVSFTFELLFIYSIISRLILLPPIVIIFVHLLLATTNTVDELEKQRKETKFSARCFMEYREIIRFNTCLRIHLVIRPKCARNSIPFKYKYEQNQTDFKWNVEDDENVRCTHTRTNTQSSHIGIFFLLHFRRTHKYLFHLNVCIFFFSRFIETDFDGRLCVRRQILLLDLFYIESESIQFCFVQLTIRRV